MVDDTYKSAYDSNDHDITMVTMVMIHITIVFMGIMNQLGYLGRPTLEA